MDEATSALDCAGGELVLQQGHVSGRITGDCRVVVQGNVVLHAAHDYTGGTWVESGALQLGHAEALGAGTVYLGNPALRAEHPVALDMAHHAVANTLVLRGNSQLRSTENFSGNIIMEHGALCAVAAGDVLRLDPGQTLTLSPGGNEIEGELVLHGGTVVLTGGALTLHGQLTLTATSTLDLRQWQNLALQQALLELDDPTAYEEGDLLLLLPEHLENVRLIYNPLSGALELKSNKPIYSPLAAFLNSNQLQVYHALLSLPDGTYGALAELQRNVAEAATAKELRELLDHASGAGYTTLLPALQEGVRQHLRRVRELAGCGARLAPDSRLAVAAQALHHTSRRPRRDSGEGYRLNQTGSHLQLEAHLTNHTAMGIALATARSRISPEQELTQKEKARYLNLSATHHQKHWMGHATLGLSRHELTPQRLRSDGSTATTLPVEADSLYLHTELAYATAEDWQVYTAFMWSRARMGAIAEQDDTTSLHLEKQRHQQSELSLGTRWNTTLGENLTLGTHAALHYHPGDTRHRTSAHFAGEPGVHFTQQSAAAPRWNYSLGAEISCPLTNHASLHASATVESEGFSTHAGIILHF